MPHPDNDPDAPHKERRATHRRQKRRDATTRVVRVKEPVPTSPTASNDPPALPDPPLRRRVPPPAPLPSEPPDEESFPPPPSKSQQQRRRVEEAIGTVGLAVLVAAMVVAMWLRMTGG